MAVGKKKTRLERYTFVCARAVKSKEEQQHTHLAGYVVKVEVVTEEEVDGMENGE